MPLYTFPCLTIKTRRTGTVVGHLLEAILLSESMAALTTIIMVVAAYTKSSLSSRGQVSIPVPSINFSYCSTVYRKVWKLNPNLCVIPNYFIFCFDNSMLQNRNNIINKLKIPLLSLLYPSFVIIIESYDII